LPTCKTRIGAQHACKNASYAYVYGIVLISAGQASRAREIPGAAHEKFPEDTDAVYALTTIYCDQGDIEQTRGYAEKLAALWPQESPHRPLVEERRRGNER
jgi:cytochrome c-type biogenesis protein CcmH/NrfG